MRNKWLIIIALFLLVSCRNESVVNESTDSFTPLLVSTSSLADIESLASTKATAVTGGSIGVFLAANTNYTAIDNVKYSYASANSDWVNSSDKLIYLTSKIASVYAYYPYTESTINSSSIRMVSQLNTSAADLCYTKSAATATMAAPSVSFALSHAYSKITINILNLYYPGVGKISKIALHNDVICKEATLDIIKGEYSALTLSTADSPLSFDPSIASLAKYDKNDPTTVTTTSVLLVPVTTLTNGTLILSLTLDNVDKSATVTMPEAKLVAGSNYVINVSIDVSAKISVNAVKCTDWIDATGLPIIRPHK